jgi:uncharacterized protein (TIGR02145 family)
MPGTNYYVRAYATNSAGTAYGNEVTFITTQITLATVTTTNVTGITTTSASSGGSISSAGGGTISSKGVCWSTSPTPTIADAKTTNGIGTATFVSSLTLLMSGTKYYVRAYATNEAGTAYGDEISFTSAIEIVLPTVTTTAISGVTATTASSGGNVTDAGNGTISGRGVCWATSTGPTIYGTHTDYGTGTGAFAGSITGLTPNTLYYVRAYATNSAGTSYGSELILTTFAATDADGNNYTSATIYTQIWLVQNLSTTKYNNGDNISTTSTPTLDISGQSTPEYQWAYGGNESNAATYGRLYTWYAITDPRGVCPTGWHVPSIDETITLANNIGGVNIAGGKLKEADTVHWSSPNSYATDDFGFKGLPGGGRDVNGVFGYIKEIGNWWTSSPATNTSNGDNRGLDYQSAGFASSNYDKRAGFSVRCIKN